MNQEDTPVKDEKKSNKSNLGKTALIVLLIILLMVGSASGTYWWRNNSAKKYEKQQAASISQLQKDKADLEKQLAAAKAKAVATPAPVTACSAKAPNAATIDNIQASITSGNTAALEGYMAPSVNVVIAASEAAGAKTPTQAVTAITNFIGDPTVGSWNFALSASVLSSYGKGSYAQYFPSIAQVGKATDKKVISFSFDCNGKISTVFMAANEGLLI
jgi:Tfp pilus assembly protein FimT